MPPQSHLDHQRTHAHHQLPLIPLLLPLHLPCKLLGLLLWSHRELRPHQLSYTKMTRLRIILVHVRCCSTVALPLLQHIRGERPSSNHARLWQLRNALLHRHLTHFPHPCPSRVPGRLRVPLKCLLRPHLHLSVVDNFAQHTRDQLLHRGRRSRLCIAWHSLTSFTRLKYVVFQFYVLAIDTRLRHEKARSVRVFP
jgi:hypothetical protein